MYPLQCGATLLTRPLALSDSTDRRLGLYCVGCNERFIGSKGDTTCPRCGVNSDDVDHAHHPTLLWKSAESWAIGKEPPRDAEEDDHQILELVGQQLDHYRCESLLGRGGMGWVFLARHAKLDRPCALKVLSPDLIERDSEYLNRFQNEGQAAAALIHQNIVTTHAIDEFNGYHYLEMEYVQGRSLQFLINEMVLSPERATALAVSIADGLGAAHRCGILHRDLKPDNVLMTLHGVPKLADFGLAKRVAVSETRQGQLAGTPHFMAPELFTGTPASPASDVYALGVCYYLMLTRQLPFARNNINALMSDVTSQPVPNVRRIREEISLEMAECLAMLLDKSPANRPRDAIAASQMLQAVLGSMQDIETLLDQAFRDEPRVDWESFGDGCIVTVELPQRRSQRVQVVGVNESGEGRLIEISSICCPVQASYFEAALRLNSELSHGAISIRKVEGADHFVVQNRYPRHTINPDELQASVFEVAQNADDIEQKLTGADRR